jgi:hypothetical protein
MPLSASRMPVALPAGPAPTTIASYASALVMGRNTFG